MVSVSRTPTHIRKIDLSMSLIRLRQASNPPLNPTGLRLRRIAARGVARVALIRKTQR
jgi:hypothetical protein